MEDITVFILILVVIVLLFMQFYFVSYRKDAFILQQVDRVSTSVTALEKSVTALALRVTALEPAPET